MDREFLIGVEINSKTVTAGLVDLSGKIVKKLSLPSEIDKGKKRAIDNISTVINRIKKNKILGVGISVPGIVSREKGMVMESPFPGWNNLLLKKLVEDQVHCPVFVENEGRCFALAEFKCGPFKKIDNTIGVLMNDTISAGFIIDGKMAKGCSFAAGLVSHMIVDSKKGKLEDFASPQAIERQFKARTKKSKSIQEIVTMEKDRVAKDILTQAGAHMGTGMAHIVNILNPELLVLGGPLAKSEAFMEAVEKAVMNRTNDICSRRVKIIGSKINDATILGASSIVI